MFLAIAGNFFGTAPFAGIGGLGKCDYITKK